MRRAFIMRPLVGFIIRMVRLSPMILLKLLLSVLVKRVMVVRFLKLFVALMVSLLFVVLYRLVYCVLFLLILVRVLRSRVRPRMSALSLLLFVTRGNVLISPFVLSLVL